MAAVPTRSCDRITVAVVPETSPDVNETFKIIKNIELRTLGEGEVLIELQYLSVDPYIRGRLHEFTNNKAVYSHCVCKVIEIGPTVDSLAIGDYVYGRFEWQTFSIVPANVCMKIPTTLPKYIENNNNNNNNDEKQEMIDLSSINKSYYIGAYGMPGMTAYYGLYEKGRLNKLDTVFVSGGAGAVGSVVGQLARLKGCKRIVGTAGTKEKCDFMKEIGFTDAINYKEFGDKDSMQQRLKDSFGKDGIDVYFDNTGGHVTEAVWDLLNQDARVIVCGQIYNYNSGTKLPQIEDFLRKLIYKEIEVMGIFVGKFKNHSKFYSQVGEWIVNGDIKVRETVIKGGFDKVAPAFCGLFTGKNVGKMVVDLTQSD